MNCLAKSKSELEDILSHHEICCHLRDLTETHPMMTLTTRTFPLQFSFTKSVQFSLPSTINIVHISNTSFRLETSHDGSIIIHCVYKQPHQPVVDINLLQGDHPTVFISDINSKQVTWISRLRNGNGR